MRAAPDSFDTMANIVSVRLDHVMRSWLFSVLASQKLQANGALPSLDLEAQVGLLMTSHELHMREFDHAS